MRIIFENELGTAVLSGGGDADIRITAISGLGIPSVERRVFTSYDFDGAVESGRKIPVRVITVGGDIRGGRRYANMLLKLLSKPCSMRIFDGDIDRMIRVDGANVEFEQTNGIYTKFALSLTCDDPYFYDFCESSVGLFVKEKLISDQTVLPAVLSRRTTKARIIPNGDCDIEAKYVISGKRIAGAEDGRIVIENITTGKTFTLHYIPSDNEVITIDMKKRTITSDSNESLIEYISDDSFLSDLVIEKEGAELFVIGYGAAADMNAYLLYRNKYTEAMV